MPKDFELKNRAISQEFFSRPVRSEPLSQDFWAAQNPKLYNLGWSSKSHQSTLSRAGVAWNLRCDLSDLTTTMVTQKLKRKSASSF